MSNAQLCTFSVGGVEFAVDVEGVQEVLRYQELTTVPLAPSAVSGLINLRGQIVTAIEMRRRLGVDDRVSEDLPMNVVVRHGAGIVSLLVDEIGDVIEVDRRVLEPPPDTLDGPTRQVVSAVCKLEDRLLLVVDTNRVVGSGLEKSS